MNEKHAVYATSAIDNVTFRVGQPTDWDTAQARWSRLTPSAATPTGRILANRRSYPVKFYEVRTVDRHGRGLGAERHARALPVPYRAHRKAGR